MNFQMYSVPGLLAAAIGLIFALVLGRPAIDKLRRMKFGQNINEDAPETHRAKQGTPTMGGVLIVTGTVFAAALSVAIMSVEKSRSINMRELGGLAAILAVFLAHALIGAVDDLRSIRGGRSLGLKAREKIAAQFVIALAFVFWRFSTADATTTQVTIWPNQTVEFGPLYYALCVVWMIGLSNAVNLSDGLDSLSASLTVLAALGLSWTVFTLHTGNEWITMFGYALVGSSLGFLWFNAHPARVFMGDTGSLAIGAGLAAYCIVGKQEVLGLLFMAVFLMEMVSVIIQVSVVRMTGGKATGRRVFRMTPIHHHFERLGWPETTVVQRFILVGAIALIVGMMLAPSMSPWVDPTR